MDHISALWQLLAYGCLHNRDGRMLSKAERHDRLIALGTFGHMEGLNLAQLASAVAEDSPSHRRLGAFPHDETLKAPVFSQTVEEEGSANSE
jgi:hypothetical protein